MALKFKTKQLIKAAKENTFKKANDAIVRAMKTTIPDEELLHLSEYDKQMAKYHELSEEEKTLEDVQEMGKG